MKIQRTIPTLLVFYFLIAFSGCNNNDDECEGNLFINTGSCTAQSLFDLGQRGVHCERCTSNINAVEFSLGFIETADPTSDVTLTFRDNIFIVRVLDCNTFNLFPFSDSSDEPVGQVSDIEVLEPDDLLLTITLQDSEPEEIFCDVCFVGPIPQCLLDEVQD
jgi:hypothetical protein